MKNVEYLVVGQGLSGTFFAFQLLLEGKSFLVVDKGFEKSSSYIAAGLINPMALKRLAKSWRATDFLNHNKAFYPKLEAFLKGRYLFNLPIHKLISSEEDEIFWQHRIENYALHDLLEEKLEQLKDPDNIFSTSFKVGTVKQTSWLNLSKLLTDFRAFLKKNALVIEAAFDHSLIANNTYEDISFKHVVFCEGAKGADNPFFNHLPFALNKGQLLSIKSDRISNHSILKKKVFILPIEKNHFKVGATFAWKWNDLKVDKQKTDLLEENIKEITHAPYEIQKEYCGVRPASRDRRPLIGRHSIHSNYFIFNGMGSKGCLMAPLLAQELYQHIEHGLKLHEEANIERFKPNLNG